MSPRTLASIRDICADMMWPHASKGAVSEEGGRLKPRVGPVI